jgi:hypothetical protein
MVVEVVTMEGLGEKVSPEVNHDDHDSCLGYLCESGFFQTFRITKKKESKPFLLLQSGYRLLP